MIYFALTGVPPFGETDPRVILARILAGQIDVSQLDTEVGDWLRRAMSAIPAERFVDAAAMQTAWRGAVRVVLDREQEMPWWRRFFSSDPETDKD